MPSSYVFAMVLLLKIAVTVVAPERLVAAPDCGMKYLPRDRAFAKLQAMVAGARSV
mgnify:CR=1 FL=1